MHPLTASEILQVWERGYRLHPVDRALTLLAAANPDTSWEQLVRLPVGQRDDQLLSLRELTFGSLLTCYAECPQCGERLEFEVEAERMHLQRERSAQAATSQLSFQFEGYRVRFRLPDSTDLAVVANSPDLVAARKVLLERCVMGVEPDDQPAAGYAGLRPDTAGGLPASLEDLLIEHIAQADPQADVQLELICPACSHAWALTFDVESFLWAEVNSQAKRLLREVDALARAYGWREADILSMSAKRRQAYLDMVSGVLPRQ
jgi:hypothetical protein